MPDGGRLTFSATSVTFSNNEKPPLADMPLGNWIMITISDTGMGIPPEDLPHLFEPFFTTKQPGKGTGLGLAQVYGIITQHDGFIMLDSEMQAGTTFTIYLPLVSESVEAYDGWRVEEAEKGNGETILVVEDNESTCEAITAVLEMLNYNTIVASNGREAFILLKKQKKSVDIVISDMLMPEMSGLELVTQMREIDCQIPIIIFSGYILEEDLERLNQLQIAGWLHKPPNLKQLASMIQHAL
jgi:CheY-like chemotaxis protein